MFLAKPLQNLCYTVHKLLDSSVLRLSNALFQSTSPIQTDTSLDFSSVAAISPHHLEDWLRVQNETTYVLAFICKALPKCPDPDPTLQW